METHEIPESQVAVVGNSRFDCSMFLDNSLNFAYKPEDEIIAEAAHHTIRDGKLSQILEHIL